MIKFAQIFDESCVRVMSFAFLSKNGLICGSLQKCVKCFTNFGIILPRSPDFWLGLIDGEEEYKVEQLVAHRYHG
jgi:hypothetical protein